MEITITYRYIVGIDISKETLDLHLHDRKTGYGSENQVTNDKQGFAEFGRWLAEQNAAHEQTLLCSEHTGRYGEHLLGWTTTAGWPHAVVKTTALKKIGGEYSSKADPLDARGLAEYARRFSDRLQLTEAPKAGVKQLRRLRAERRKMVDQRAALKAKCTEAGYHDADMGELLTMWEQQIALLSEHIARINQRISQLITQTPQLNERSRQMRSAPGMGKVLGCLWLTLFADQHTLDPRKISSRFGFAPHCYQSGSSVSRPNRSSGFGNADMRRVMHQAALSVAQNYEHYRTYYQRKRAEGKHHLVVINNIINKLIDLYCAMWNKRADYDPNYIQKMNQQWKKSA